MPAGGVRNLNRRGQGLLVAVDLFDFLYVATSCESLNPQRVFDHCRSAFDFRVRRTHHWRSVALWKPVELSS